MIVLYLSISTGPFTGSTQAQQPPKPQMTSDQKKFLQFAEKHRTVLNQILRQSTVHLSDGPFAVLVDHTRILDFDVKRRYFRTELERMDEGIRREELAVHVHRVTVFEDSFRELYRRNPEEWKNRFYIVFEGMGFSPSYVMCAIDLHQLCFSRFEFDKHRRGGSRCWRFVARVVRDYLTRDLQSNVCVVHCIAW